MTADDAITGYESAAHQSFQGLATDWSSQHVVFSKPAPGSDAEDKVQQDPRYWAQQIRRNQASSDEALADAKNKNKKKKKKPVPLKKDWTMNLQGTASANVAGVVPAKYSFAIASQSCSDFVAYPTGQAPTAAHPSIVGFTALYTGGGCGSTIPTVFFSYDTAAADAGAIVTSPVLSSDGKQIAFAEGTHLVLIKLPTSATTGTLSGPSVLTLSGSASAYNTCIPGATGCMFAFSLTNADTNSSAYYDNFHDTIYVGDSKGLLHKFNPVFGGVPAAIGAPWPVAADAGDTLTGPVFDINSSNVYVGDSSGFINQVNSSTGTVVRSGRLGAGSGTVTINTDPAGGDTTVVGATTYTWHATCPNGVSQCVVHSGSTTQDAANLAEAINNTCGSTANCVVTAANASATATSTTNVTTVQNTTTGNVAFTNTSGGITIAPTTGGIAVGMLDAPIIDSGAATVYSFLGRDATTTASAGVRQLTIPITSGGIGTLAAIGTSSQTTPVYSGSFDNKYFTAATPTGNLYVCGNAGGVPTLYGIAINTTIGTVTTGPALGTVAGTTCSPITELCNPGTGTCANTPTGTAVDWLFLSIRASVNATRTPSGCTAVAGQGCVMAFDVNAPPITATTNASSSANEAGGTSAISIDNVVSNATGGSQVYFTPLANQTCTGNTSTGSTGTGPCATQASQSGL